MDISSQMLKAVSKLLLTSKLTAHLLLDKRITTDYKY
jgi:hypothetical protein